MRWMGIDVTVTDTGRRRFLGGLIAVGVAPGVTWADAGSPAFLSAAAQPDGRFVLCGIGRELDIRFTLSLPARGHAAAAHPLRPEAVAFARRPGTFALVIDCVLGTQMAVLEAPEGRHFYGHGVFSSDGRYLFTTENDYEAGRGRIGVWDAGHGYRRIADWDSGGIGPHDIALLPGSDTLVVANGGIDTHPDTGRTKLNIATMAPNLAYVQDGVVVETAALPAHLHKNSIRHLSVGHDGHVAFGIQWQGDGPAPVLAGAHRMGQTPRLMTAPEAAMRDMQGYVGSIALSSNGRTISVTSPRGGVLQHYDVATAELLASLAMPDVSGVAVMGGALAVSAGTGALHLIGADGTARERQTRLQWDNHLVAVGTTSA